MMKTVMNMSKSFKQIQNIHILNMSLKNEAKKAQLKTAVKLPHVRKLSDTH